MQCILRMCSTIMNLLSLANEDSVPGADDFVPVLVFVLIKVGPSLLLREFIWQFRAGWCGASRALEPSALPSLQLCVTQKESV